MSTTKTTAIPLILALMMSGCNSSTTTSTDTGNATQLPEFAPSLPVTAPLRSGATPCFYISCYT